MYAVIGAHDARLSIPTLVYTEVDTCHGLFYSVSDANQYIEEQTGIPHDEDHCPLRVVEVIDLNGDG
jgi:hypothetical protein